MMVMMMMIMIMMMMMMIMTMIAALGKCNGLTQLMEDSLLTEIENDDSRWN